jgi:flagellar biosynthesis protein FliQ
MTDTTVLSLVNGLMLTGLKLAAPILLTALTVGVAISVVQAATQVQEMTLTYVPKILAIALVVALFGPWLLQSITAYATGLLGHLDQYVN